MTDVNAFLSRWQAQEIAIFGHLNLALENFCCAFKKRIYQTWQRQWRHNVIQQQIGHLCLLGNFSGLHGRGVVVRDVLHDLFELVTFGRFCAFL